MIRVLNIYIFDPFFSYKPKKAFIVTTWRSGSTFLSLYMHCHPMSFYFEEPLNYLGISRIKEENDNRTDVSLNILRNFMNCKFDYAKSK